MIALNDHKYHHGYRKSSRQLLTHGIILLLLLFFITRTCGAQAIIEVHAKAHTRYQTPIELSIDKPLNPRFAYRVKNIITGKTAPLQYSNTSLLFILPDTIHPNQIASFSIEKIKKGKQNPVHIFNDKKGLTVQVRNNTVLRYHTREAEPPQNNPKYYARSGFIHPLYSPSGAVLTDDFPQGHMHQHGIMMAWVSTQFKNFKPDFWNQQHQTGNVKHVKVVSTEEGPVSAKIKVQHQHYLPTGEEVLSEIWTITVYAIQHHYLFDIQSDQHNTTADTLFLNAYHYGGMAFRGTKQWNPDDSLNFKNNWQIKTDQGYTVANANATHAAYVTTEGLIDNLAAGVTIFGFPDNFRYPQALRVHPTMPYWCYAPSVDGEFSILPNEKYTSRYRYYVYDNSSNDVTIRNLHFDIVDPPEVRWIKQ